MLTFISRRRFLAVAAATLFESGCGTILHPERRGQPSGPLDWKIVALDAIGLFFFFIPGVIAFAVDFNNGTIYLPADRCCTEADRVKRRKLVSVQVPRQDLTEERIEGVVSSHLKRPVQLKAGEYERVPLGSAEDFWQELDRRSA